jgi:NAD-dependent SIR2 family protein deacetylase
MLLETIQRPFPYSIRNPMSEAFIQASQAISQANALIFAAGAGIGVDSGLPDFRGNEGFWKAYPPFAERGLSFYDVANPRWFDERPKTAWGFYGHRLNLYRATTPHAGFSIMREWARGKNDDYFIFTSNVDGQFQKAGFDESRIVECHGSLHHLQCSLPCSDDIWSADDLEIEIDEETFEAVSELPVCPKCGNTARPNVLMFSDRRWIWNRTYAQEQAYRAWQRSLREKEVTVIECGAGTAVPSVRAECEGLQQSGAVLVRINPREAEGPPGTISLEYGALEGLLVIKEQGGV